MGDYVDVYLDFFNEFNKSVDKTDQLPVKIIAGNLRDHDIIGCVIDWTQQYLAARQCPSSLIAQICKYVVTEMQVYRAVDPGGCGYQKDSNVWNPLKLMQATIKKVIDVCQRHKDRSSVSRLTPPRDNLCLTILSTNKNARRTMEDKYTVIDDLHEMLNIEGYGPGSFYAVLDGHGGAEAAMYGASRLFQCLAESPLYPSHPGPALVHAFKQCDAQYVEKAKAENLQSGTTAVVAVLLQELRKLYIAWIGDSQAVLSRREGEVTQLVFPPHRPTLDSEKERIEQMGGCVLYFNGQCRVQGTLAVSRAIGDKDFKPYVCADPEVLCIDLDGSEDFLLLATDGLWEEVTEVEVAHAVYTHLIQYKDQNLKHIPDSLIQLAKARGSKDNITCLLVFLRPPALVPAATALPRLRAMQSPPPLAPAPPSPRYNGAGAYRGGGEEDFGPETDVDGEVTGRHHLHHHAEVKSKTLGSDEHHDLELSSDSEEGEGEEGGGWDFVQTSSVKVKDSLQQRHAALTETNSSDSEADDMNHPLNPDAAEFVPVHSPDHTSGPLRRPQGEFRGNNGHGEEHEVDFAKAADLENSAKIDLGNNHTFDLEKNHKFDLENDLVGNNHKFDLEKNVKGGSNFDDVINTGDVVNGKHDAEDSLARLGVADDDVILACSPGKPKGLQRLEDEREFLSDIQQRPSSGFENGEHEELNGFQSLDSSHTHATLGDTTYLSDLTSPPANHVGSGDVTTSSLSPTSPELHPGATTNPFDLHTGSNAFETSQNVSHDFEEKHAGGDFEFIASPIEQNGFSNDFTGTNQEVSKTLVDTGLSGDEAQHESPRTIENDFTSVDKSPLNFGFGDSDTKATDLLQDSLAADTSSVSQHAAMPQFDSTTFNEFHTANDASAIFEKTSETSPFFGKDQTQTDLHLSDQIPVSGAEETITSMLDLVDTPPSQERRVSSEVLEAYHAVVHSMDTPLAQNHSEDFGFDSKPKQDFGDAFGFSAESKKPLSEDFGFNVQPKQEPLESSEERETFEGLNKDSFNGEKDTAAGFNAQPKLESSEENDAFEGLNRESFNGENDTAERFDKEVDVGNGSYVESLVDVKQEVQEDSGEGEQPHQTETDEFEFHQEADRGERELMAKLGTTEVETIAIGGMTPGDCLQKHSGDSTSYDEIHGIHKDETHGDVGFETVGNRSENHVIQEEDEEEIQIGKKVSDLNETDIMSRSFYGDYESQEPARSPSPEEMIDHFERQSEGNLEASLGEQERTPTGDGTSLEAKLAEEAIDDNPQEHGSFAGHVDEAQSHLVEENAHDVAEDKPKEDIVEDTPQFTPAEEKQATNLFDISHEEASFTEKTSQVYDDLTFESSTVLETNLDDVPSQDSKPEPHGEDILSAPTIPDVIPTQGDDNASSPTVDLTQDIVEETKVPPVEEESKPADAVAETVETSDVATTVAAAAAVAAGTVAAAAAVKKATAKKPAAGSVSKKPDAKPVSKTAAKPLTKPAVAKSSAKPATVAPAKPAPKPAAPKPLAAKPAAAPKPTAPRKPLASSTLSKSSVSSVAASKSSVSSVAASKTSVSSVAAKPAAPKPRAVTSAPATKPLTNGVAKRPASASTTAAPSSKAPAAPRVPLSMRTSKPASTTAAPKPSAPPKSSITAPPKSTTTKLSTTTTKTSTAAPRPSAPKPSSTTASKSAATGSSTAKSSLAAKPSLSAAKPSLAARSSGATKPVPQPARSPSAAAAAVAAARKSPATRRPLLARGKNSPSPAIPKTEPRSEADAVIRKPTPATTPSEAPGEEVTKPIPETSSQPVEVMTNGH